MIISICSIYGSPRLLKRQMTLIVVSVALVLSMTSACAASSANLAVSGKVTSGSCGIDVPDVDFGHIGWGGLTTIGTHAYDRLTNLSISCPASTELSLKITDNYSEGKPGEQMEFAFPSTGRIVNLGPDSYYGLVDDNGRSIGAHAMSFGTFTVDGFVAPVTARSRNNKDWWYGALEGRWAIMETPYIRPSDSDLNAIQGMNFKLPMYFAFSLLPKNHRESLVENATFNGSLTMEIIRL